MKMLTCEQRSVEWYQVRRGVPTASDFDKIITTKGEPSKQRSKYMYQLAGEMLGGVIEETYSNGAMLRGIELETEARAFYALINEPVTEVGFCLNDFGFGCSPDGMVGEEGLIEIKCPIISTHVEYLLNNKVPTEYIQQVQGQLLVTGRQWCDFLSYYPGLKPLIVRVERDEQFLPLLDRELKQFIIELNEIVERLSK